MGCSIAQALFLNAKLLASFLNIFYFNLLIKEPKTASLSAYLNSENKNNDR